jgi:hypothetical protein
VPTIRLLSILIFFLLIHHSSYSQEEGLEGIIVEKYYVADSNDISDEASGDPLEEGAVTYRIYVDLREGYKLQMIIAMDGHPIEIRSTAKFHNNQFAGRATAHRTSAALLNQNIRALDSWLSLGMASNEEWGVLKIKDPDGSRIGGKYNDGGSNAVEQGLLVNNDATASPPITESDGLMRSDDLEPFKAFEFNLEKPIMVFDDLDNDGIFYVEDGAFAHLPGAVGPTSDNQILIAQITTSGEISYRLNLQIITPDGQVQKYIASDRKRGEYTHPDLIYPSTDKKTP